MRTLFRYVVMNLDLNYAYEIEIDKKWNVGMKTSYFDPEDNKWYDIRILTFEGTVYNKSKEQVERERLARAV